MIATVVIASSIASVTIAHAGQSASAPSSVGPVGAGPARDGPGTMPAASPSIVPTPEAVAEARKLFAGPEFRDTMMAGVLATMQTRVRAMEGRDDMSVPARFFDRLHEAMLPEIERIIDREVDNIRDRVAEVYARHFSIDELRELNILFRNPVYRRMERLNPTLILQTSETVTAVLTPYRQRFEQIGMDVARRMLEEDRQRLEGTQASPRS